MASQLSKEEYLKKYLGGDKKKKRVKILKGKGTRVVDDDAAMPSAGGDSELADALLGTAEDKPQVVGDVSAASAAAAAKKRWKTLDDCDLEELESQRRLLSESLKLLEQSGGVAVEGEQAVRRRHDSSDSGSASDSAGSSSGSSDADSDASSRRRRRRTDDKRRSRRSSDTSPSRRKPPAAALEAGGIWPDSDASPPRKRAAGEAAAAPSRRENGVAAAGGEKRPDSDESPPRSWKRTRPERTLDGKRAGLQDITALRAENKTAKLRELSNMKEMDESLSGRHADTKVRGRKLEQARERAREDEKARERKKKYDAWSKGVKQTEQQQARLVDHLKEMSKPMARYADDDDLEHQLKARPRADDPMAAFIQRKQDKQQVGKKVRPRYDKSDPPPNRYSIWPGYRWDGVDRSNGFERQYFLRKNAKKARDSDAYKWSTEDM